MFEYLKYNWYVPLKNQYTEILVIIDVAIEK